MKTTIWAGHYSLHIGEATVNTPGRLSSTGTLVEIMDLGDAVDDGYITPEDAQRILEATQKALEPLDIEVDDSQIDDEEGDADAA